MTNAEKLLKVSAEEFIDKYTEWYFSIERELEKSDKDVYEFLRAECKPTLTEDERVILRNIPKDYETIGKCKNGILYVTTDRKNYLYRAFGVFFNHLFQFIKERRRIFY